MVRLTLIARKHDGLPLSEGLDTDNHHDMEPYKQQAKVCNYHSQLANGSKVFPYCGARPCSNFSKRWLQAVHQLQERHWSLALSLSTTS